MTVNKYLLLLFFLSCLACSRHYQPTTAEPINYRMTPADTVTHSLFQIIAPYKTALDEQMGEVIGKTNKRLFKEKPESPLGNWLTDALQAQVQSLSSKAVDASVQNYGGIRIPELPEGEVTLGKLYELMPFDNMLVVVEMTGRVTQQFFDHIAADGGWPVSREISFVLKGKRADRLMIHGKPLDPEATYRISLPDYIANGGGDCSFLVGLPRENTGRLVRDLLIKHTRELTLQNKLLEAQVEGRIIWGD